MSGSLVDAIDKRRKGPDLTPAPAELRGVLEAMLRPDPKDRLRSMDEVDRDGRRRRGYIPPTAPPMSMPVSQPPPSCCRARSRRGDAAPAAAARRRGC